MSEMVDRVAKAMEERATRGLAMPPWREIARVAIEEMREPTELMGYQMTRVALTSEMYGKQTHDYDKRILSADELERIGYGDGLRGNPSKWHFPDWRAAIDEALK